MHIIEKIVYWFVLFVVKMHHSCFWVKVWVCMGHTVNGAHVLCLAKFYNKNFNKIDLYDDVPWTNPFRVISL